MRSFKTRGSLLVGYILGEVFACDYCLIQGSECEQKLESEILSVCFLINIYLYNVTYSSINHLI